MRRAVFSTNALAFVLLCTAQLAATNLELCEESLDAATLEEQLQFYFVRHNPHKLGIVKELAASYANKQNELSLKLEVKYGEALPIPSRIAEFESASLKWENKLKDSKASKAKAIQEQQWMVAKSASDDIKKNQLKFEAAQNRFNDELQREATEKKRRKTEKKRLSKKIQQKKNKLERLEREGEIDDIERTDEELYDLQMAIVHLGIDSRGQLEELIAHADKLQAESADKENFEEANMYQQMKNVYEKKIDRMKDQAKKSYHQLPGLKDRQERLVKAKRHAIDIEDFEDAAKLKKMLLDIEVKIDQLEDLASEYRLIGHSKEL